MKQQWTETHIGEDAAEEGGPPEGEEPDQAAEAPAAPVAAGTQAGPASPTGAGWVVEIQGYHYHNEDRHKPNEGAQYVRTTLVKSLLGKGDKVLVSAGPLAGKEVPVSDLGIGFPVIIRSSRIHQVTVPIANLTEVGVQPPPSGLPPQGADAVVEGPAVLRLRRYDFVLQFSWQPRPAGQAAPAPPAAPAPE